MRTLLFYQNRDNDEVIQLTEGGTAVDLSSVTKVSINFKGTEYDSTTYSTAFDWSAGSGKITLRLGDISTIPAKTDGIAELIIYDPSHTDGQVWGNLRIKILSLS